MTDRRRLIVMRHAKAEPFGETDAARPLTDRGLASARDVGAFLRDEDVLPEHAVVSTALRTRETWDAVAESSGVTQCEVWFDEALFSGSADVALDTLRRLPEDASTVMFIGHNPTAAFLCHYLDDGEGDPTAVAGLLQGFPPGAVAVLEVGVAWADLGPETGRVVGYHVGGG